MTPSAEPTSNAGSIAPQIMPAPLPGNVDRRAWLAGMAFAGLLAAPDLDLDLATLAQHAVDAADALATALDVERK